MPCGENRWQLKAIHIMSSVFEAFARDLAILSLRYQEHPEREMLHLLFLALEREEIVSVSYRETLILQRLRGMPISAEVQNLMHHALVWAWKDEQMHAVYLRGAIVRLGSRGLRLRAYLRQMMGFMGGWAGSVRQHLRWSQAPISHTLATSITFIGMLTGMVPEDVREYLRYRPFRDFCIFNVDAEKTAALCYERMMALVPLLPDVDPDLLDDMRRVCEDEQRHTRIFEYLAAALDEQDRLVPNETLDTLSHKIAGVGDYFLPRSLRAPATGIPFAPRKSPVWVKQGTSAEEKLPLFRAMLAETGLSQCLEERAHSLGKEVSELKIAIKAAFMMGYHHKDRSIITDPELLEPLVDALRDVGCRQIAVADARNIYDNFYENRTVKQVADYFGISGAGYEVVDFSEDQAPHSYGRGMAQHSVARTWKEAEFRISFAKMRSHATEQVYLTVGNLDSVGARTDEFLFPERQAHRDTAVMTLIADFPPDLSLLDAYDSAADGLLGMMGCPRPKVPRRLYAGVDALALDMTAAKHMGLSDPRRSRLLNTACHWFGDPFPNVEVIGEDAPLPRWRGPYSNEWTTLLSLIAYPVYEFGSCRGALFVPEMDTRAFPLLGPVSLPIRAGRKAIQLFLGLHHW